MRYYLNTATALLTTIAVAALLSGCLGGKPQYFDSDGVKLAYTTQGDGPTLVLIHGFQGTSAVHWALPGTIDLLSENFRVVALDCRGHGRSGKPTDMEDYGSTMVEDLAQLLDHLDEDQVYLAGFSMGAWISLKFSAAYPERVRALAVAGGGWRDFNEKSIAEFLSGLVLPFIHRGYSRRAFAACSGAFPDFQLTAEDVEALPGDMLLLAGSLDFARPDIERLAEARSDAQFEVIPGADHNGTLYAREFQKALDTFFREIAR
jgi:pimeloyl-ACP methyl ester carboxylesterase